MSNMRVCIVMAVYNGEKYLAEQLDSLLNQSYRDFNIYAYDDGSSDSSIKILEEYAQKDSRIHFFKNRLNKGYAQNFIDGVRAADADIVFLADQDDIWHFDKLKVMTQLFAVNPYIGLLISDDKSFCAASSNIVMENINEGDVYKKNVRKITAGEFLRRGAYRGMNTALSRFFIQKILSDKDFSTECPAHDWLFELLACKNDCMYKADIVLAYHRQHDSNTADAGNDTTNKYTVRVSSTKKKITIYDWITKHINDEAIVRQAEINLRHHMLRLNLLTSGFLKKGMYICLTFGNAVVYKFPKKRICADFIFSFMK